MILRLLVGVAVVTVAGLLAAWGARRVRRWREFRLRVTLEDALKHLYADAERGRPATTASLAGRLNVSLRRSTEIARLLHERGLVLAGDQLVLTPAGRRAGREIVRAHRLWERWLADEVDVPIEALHRLADQREHRLGTREVAELAARLGHPRRDPHGDPIPVPDEATMVAEGIPVTMMPRGALAEIVHLEDEPEDIFQRLVEHGLAPGQLVAVLRLAPDRLTLGLGDHRVDLSPVDAANVTVVPAADGVTAPVRTLDDLTPGQSATVSRVQASGFARRRLYDLGFTPGTTVECAFASAFGEPRAYRVRGSVIALRPAQARRIETAGGTPGASA